MGASGDTMTDVIIGVGTVTANGAVLAGFDIEAGSTVTIDRANASRRTCSIKIAQSTLSGNIPTNPTDLFSPLTGNEMTMLWASYADGVEQLSRQVGLFSIVEVAISDTGKDLTMTVTGEDRAATYTRAGFTDTYVINGGTNVVTAIQALLSSIPVNFTQVFSMFATTLTTPSAPIVYGPGNDPWAEAQKLAASIGYELFMDVYGTITAYPIPNPSTQPIAATYIEGVANTAVAINRALSNKSVTNYIMRDGQGSGVTTPVRGIAEDLNPNSPTFVYGPYGRVIDYKSSSAYTTQAQAQAAAQSDLYIALGSEEKTSISITPDATLDVDDVISVQRARAGIATPTLYVIDSITHGFDSATVTTLTTRAVAAGG